jgi:fructokinase
MNPIVGVGELLWDIYPDGKKVAGGAPFNFAFHCHLLGHAAAVVSRVGRDDLGRELRERVRELGLSDEFIQDDGERPTGTVRVSVDAMGQPIYAIDTTAAWGNLEWSPAFDLLGQVAAAVCHGTLARRGGAGSRNAIAALVEQVGRRGGPTIYDVNLRGKIAEYPDEACLLASSWIKVNNDELGAVEVVLDGRGSVDSSVADSEEVFELLAKKSTREKPLLIVTRGAEGAEAIGRGIRVCEPASATKVVDTVGAGDAFTAAMVCLHLEGRPLSDCLRFANYYAARVCEHRGATPRIDRREVEEATSRVPGG